MAKLLGLETNEYPASLVISHVSFCQGVIMKYYKRMGSLVNSTEYKSLKCKNSQGRKFFYKRVI